MCDCCDYIAARGGDPDDPALGAEFERHERARIRGLVREGGWLVQAVDGWPPFAYTIGLWSRGLPELCVFGLDPSVAQRVLNGLGDAVAAGTPIEDESELRLDEWELRAFRIPNPAEVVLTANWFYRRRPRQSVPALQIVYPDAHGVWPWEPDCQLFPGQQPMPGNFAA